jgi:hypothetical protein
MITRMPRSCVVHRAALLDFVDGGPRTAVSAAALAHLERCRACEEELAGVVRTVAALRRLGRATALVEPPAHAWPALRARVLAKRPDRWIPRFSIGGLAVSAALAVLIGLPATISPGGSGWYYPGQWSGTGTDGATPLVRPAAQRPIGREGVTAAGSATLARSNAARHFDPRVYGEGSWSPAPGVPKPRPR